jgi:uncharacterized membrane protein
VSAREPPTVPRYLSIDILRGVTILLMIQVHFVEYLSWRDSASAWLYRSSMILGSVSAPLFAFLSGVSYTLWLRKQEELRCRDRDITRRTLRRGYFLFVLGLVLNFAVWLPEETFNWDILTLLGTAFLFLAVARKLPPPVLVVMCVAVLPASPPLRVVGGYASYWDDAVYSYDFTIRDILFGFVANGYFPVFPWIIFPIAGFICGDALSRRRDPSASHPQAAAVGLGLVAIAGLALAVGSQLPHLITLHYAGEWTEFPASTGYVLATLGITILSQVALHR